MIIISFVMMMRVAWFIERILFKSDVVHFRYSILFHVVDLPGNISKRLAFFKEFGELWNIASLGRISDLLVKTE